VILKSVHCYRQTIKIFKKYYFERLYFDDDLRKRLKIQNDLQENDDFQNAKICKIYKDINDFILDSLVLH